MEIYLPIAGISADIFSLITLGFLAGLISGICGLGGGLITTPILIMIGVGHSVAVAIASMQILASSLSSILVQRKSNLIAFKLGFFLLAGGIIGGLLGIKLFEFLSEKQSLDITIHFAYLFLLTYVGITVIIDLISSKCGYVKKPGVLNKIARRIVQILPIKIYFPVADLRISVCVPIILGVLGGSVVSFMGIGGGLILVPLMIYVLRIQPRIAVATSLFQILFTSTLSCYLHSTKTQSIDLVLAVFIILGASVGSQIGTRLINKLSPNLIKIILAITVLSFAIKLTYDLIIPPIELYEINWNI